MDCRRRGRPDRAALRAPRRRSRTSRSDLDGPAAPRPLRRRAASTTSAICRRGGRRRHARLARTRGSRASPEPRASPPRPSGAARQPAVRRRGLGVALRSAGAGAAPRSLRGRRSPSASRSPRPAPGARSAPRALDINVLMLIAAAGAVALGQWSEAAAVVFLFAVAQALEARTLERARSAIRALMDLTPAEALVVATRRASGAVPVDEVAPGARHRRPARREDPARRRGGRRRERREPGAGHRGVAAGGQGAGRRGVRRDHQRPRRARRPRDARAARHDARADHPSGRARAGAARAVADARRAVRARLHAGGDRAGRSLVAVAPPLVLGPVLAHLDLPCARAAGRLVSVRAGDLDAGLDRGGAGRRRAQGRAHQGRRAPRAREPRSAAWRSTRPAR